MLNKTIIKIGRSLLMIMILNSICYLISFAISNYYHASFKDVMFFEGIAITLGVSFFSIQGTSHGFTHHGFGDMTSLRTIKMERESNDYIEEVINRSDMTFTFNNLTIIF